MVLAASAATLFLSAALLLAVQPMVSKVVLPLLGGGAAVWTTCMLFFQVALLLGYLHAHAGPRLLGIRRHALVHVGLLAASLLLLPLAVRSSAAPASGSPVPWLLGLLTASIGVPFVLVATTGPLLQRWFAESGHPAAARPYFLYSASNAGSLLALLAYPFLIEPLVPLGTQRLAWSIGYAMLAVAVAACAVLIFRRPSTTAPTSHLSPLTSHAVKPQLVVKWIGLAFVPSGLMLAVTTHVTTDVAPVPLLWVVPLALYLLTFVLAFARRPRPPHALWVRIQPVFLAVTAVGLFFGDRFVAPVYVPFHLLAFFVTAMVCHGELVRLAPPAGRLTEFYLSLSFGGALGGFFCAVVAPLLFRSVAEYPILIVLACILRPPWPEEWTRKAVAELLLTLSIAALVGVMLARGGAAFRLSGPGSLLAFTALVIAGLVVVLLTATQGDRRRFAVMVAALIAGGMVVQERTSRAVYADRNFYGPREVRDDGYRLTLVHGSTLHGMQRKGERSGEPTSYYDRRGPMGDVFRAVPPPPTPVRVAVAGLGTGALAAYGRAGDRFDFYEIDPDMVHLARDAGYFSFLRRSPAEVSVVVGDARLRLADAPDGAYDLIVLDAFSSDAIPVHLLTREAIAGYLEKLKPRGMIALHLSNRYLDLVPVVAALETELGLTGRVRTTSGLTAAQIADGVSGSTWAVLARDESGLRTIPRRPGWRALEGREDVPAWTDDYSNVFRVFRMR
jgi:SAM-dependent methyltransferase